ncbi:MAG TPA: peptidoglycan recognition family protein, partial [Candidatus Limnocylindrales bacterium]|nr:peptidoglycan recognition family protein [Candidatus Limnocylindrales bacterium]
MSRIWRRAAALLGAALLVALLPALLGGNESAQPPPVRGERLELNFHSSPLVVELPMVATHVSFSWPEGAGHDENADGHEDEERQPALSVSFSADGVSYGPETEVWPDHAVVQDDLVHSSVIWTGGAGYLRLTAGEPPGRLIVGAIDAGTQDQGPRAHSAAAAVDQPQVISRSGWGADESLRFWQPGETITDPEQQVGDEKWPPMFFSVQKLIVHHTAGANNDPNPGSTIRAIYYNQAINRGWGDIGYNFLIDEQGRIYEGRHSRRYSSSEMPNGEDGTGKSVQGAHVANHNSGTVGIALLGHLVNQDATPAARASLERLLAWLAERHDIDPLGEGMYVNPHPEGTTQKHSANISGHRDWASTACPGGTFYANLPQLRQAVASRIAGGSPSPSPGPTPTPTTPPTGAPTVPQGLVASAHDNFVIKLSWQPSSSSVAGTIRYRVFRNGSAIGTQQTALTYTDQRLKVNTF